MPELRVWALGRPKLPNQSGRILIRVGLCEPCGRKLTADDLVSDAGWEDVLGAFQREGKAEPDRASIEIDLVKIEQTRRVN
ncbi:hypothetical protein [Mesorhizobium sp. M8A.F.Ca.ET.021.01.1.1]|uniref:hypothetical protein n=1 Tax=Mesorhizobium sp. M8A.F.Ca.ET.021.01.1.1 TaxID=2496757 RepID=UPI000FC9F0A9|nr:hypothetical protein [Mesorhizobium sp. M8A.F.Ca.ET.021.01.1.1]RUW46085.1 hypothetical protein EOA36_26450 [Mesorhizobium sp. M8A.F.Ca.ET.021.01.1.1]